MHNPILNVSIPTDWTPALLGQGTGHMPETHRNAFRRWRTDMRREFGDFYVADVFSSTAIDLAHEGTEYGMPAWTRCQTVTLAFEPMEH